jgi:daunorubicin resistance ABC transporter membrane protein
MRQVLEMVGLWDRRDSLVSTYSGGMQRQLEIARPRGRDRLAARAHQVPQRPAARGLIQPVLFLFVLGTGLSSLARRGMPHGVDFKTFIYPGVLAMSVLFTAIFSAASIVWDREFGFLREMLVAPVSRAALVIGKCLGGATVATFQGIVILILAGLAYVAYSPVLIITLIGELLLSFTLTAFGVMMAARIKQIQAFMALTQMLILPLFFLSGALYPLNGLPTWLGVVTRFDPLWSPSPSSGRPSRTPGRRSGCRRPAHPFPAPRPTPPRTRATCTQRATRSQHRRGWGDEGAEGL